VIGSRNLLCCAKSREALATCALSGCRSSTGTRWWETGNFSLYAPPLTSCDLRRMYHGGGVTWRNGIEFSGISELCAPVVIGNFGYREIVQLFLQESETER